MWATQCHQVSADHVDHPVGQAQVSHVGSFSVKDVGLQVRKGVNPKAGMQMLPAGLLS